MQGSHAQMKADSAIADVTPLLASMRIKDLARKTICFSNSVLMHDTVIGLLIVFINRYEFGRAIGQGFNRSRTLPKLLYQILIE